MNHERTRLTCALLLSLLVHALLLRLLFDGRGFTAGIGVGWRIPSFDRPALSAMLVPPDMTAQAGAIVEGSKQTPSERPFPNGPALALSTSVAPIPGPLAATIVPGATPSADPRPQTDARPGANAKPKTAAPRTGAPQRATATRGRVARPGTVAKPATQLPPGIQPSSAGAMPAVVTAKSGNAGLPPAPPPDRMALAQTDEPAWNVPVVPPMPTPATSASSNIAGPDVPISSPQDASDDARAGTHDPSGNGSESIETDASMPEPPSQERQDASRQEATVREEAAAETARLEPERDEDAARQAAAAQQEAERREVARRAAEQEAQRRDTERQEAARADAARFEAERQEALRQAAAQQEAQRQEIARQAAAEQEAQRQEAARQAAAEQEAQRRETEREEAARADAARFEAERQEALRQAAQQEAQRQEIARQAAAEQEAQRQEAARQAAAEQEAQRRETERQEAARADAARFEAERQEALRQAAAQQEAQHQETARQAAAEQEAQRQEAVRQAEARREERLRAIGRQLDEEAARREAASNAARPTNTLPLSLSLARRVKLWGRYHANAELVRYAEAWAWKIQSNTSFDTVRDIVKWPHRTPLVTVAIRSDGSVESVTIEVSSGVTQVDDALRRIVEGQRPYQAFPPELAREFDVIEIRRTWHFGSAVQLD